MPKKRAAAEVYDSDDGFVEKKPKTKHSSMKKEIVGGGSRNEQGEEFWEISGMRRLVVSEFKGKRMISIREFYEKDGQVLPGKKGITLPLNQFSTLITLLPHIETVLKEKGESLPRPNYDTESMQQASEDDENEEDPPAKHESKRQNFEETSEEE